MFRDLDFLTIKQQKLIKRLSYFYLLLYIVVSIFSIFIIINYKEAVIAWSIIYIPLFIYYSVRMYKNYEIDISIAISKCFLFHMGIILKITYYFSKKIPLITTYKIINKKKHKIIVNLALETTFYYNNKIHREEFKCAKFSKPRHDLTFGEYYLFGNKIGDNILNRIEKEYFFKLLKKLNIQNKVNLMK